MPMDRSIPGLLLPMLRSNVCLLVATCYMWRGEFYTNEWGNKKQTCSFRSYRWLRFPVWNPNASGGPAPLFYAWQQAVTTIYAVGNFTTMWWSVEKESRCYRCHYRRSHRLESSAQSNINTVAVSGSTVYIGGYFTQLGGQTRSRIAAIDAITGAPTSWNPTVIRR